jgi:hypothetical protein
MLLLSNREVVPQDSCVVASNVCVMEWCSVLAVRDEAQKMKHVGDAKIGSFARNAEFYVLETTTMMSHQPMVSQAEASRKQDSCLFIRLLNGFLPIIDVTKSCLT